ncbi:pyruvate formate-lyase-activating protein [Marispirochaeta sp.]|uniref:pyruvate formate-lyase-activating protein n=1 Tax=Marispirochaeta sp. TaxID=2038653 RepID=UPI0029C930A2|nr:pyruvate formate-lyase-activating protein [Marispirochaeta sp.]
MKGFEGNRNRIGSSLDTRNTVARVHSVETFGTLDGPGIRYVLFFQGCPLRCKYCQNRDTWDHGGGSVKTLDEVEEDILRYRSFMDSSGGGFTAGGGEPLLQAEFLSSLFQRLKSKGIHTALDTSGFCTLSAAVKELLASTDLILLDIKHIDEARHRELTGVSSGPVRAFAEYAASRGVPFRIRHVIVPGYTDDPQSAADTAAFIRSLPGVQQVDLIPYHELGKFKWEALGKKYPLEGVSPPGADTMKMLEEIFGGCGLPVLS